MDHLAALAHSTEQYRQCLSLVTPEHLPQPSYCPGWSIYDLINHVNGGGHRYLLLLRGAEAHETTATRTQDHVGSDPSASHRIWSDPLATAFAEPRTFERIVHHPAGDRTGLDLLKMRVLEQTLHGWDLSISLELNEKMNKDISVYLLDECVGLLTELRATGRYAELEEGGGQGDEKEARLLRLAGRRRPDGVRRAAGH